MTDKHSKLPFSLGVNNKEIVYDADGIIVADCQNSQFGYDPHDNAKLIVDSVNQVQQLEEEGIIIDYAQFENPETAEQLKPEMLDAAVMVKSLFDLAELGPPTLVSGRRSRVERGLSTKRSYHETGNALDFAF